MVLIRQQCSISCLLKTSKSHDVSAQAYSYLGLYGSIFSYSGLIHNRTELNWLIQPCIVVQVSTFFLMYTVYACDSQTKKCHSLLYFNWINLPFIVLKMTFYTVSKALLLFFLSCNGKGLWTFSLLS